MKLSIHRLALGEIAEANEAYGEAGPGFQEGFTRLVAFILKYPEAFQVHHGVVRKAVLQKYPEFWPWPITNVNRTTGTNEAD